MQAQEQSSPRTKNLQPIPILMYHQIGQPPPRGHQYRGLTVTPAAFARQMLWLKLLGYTGLSMSALQPYLNGERKGKVVGITLDDGYLNQLTHALPVLMRHGFSSTCYVVSAMAGKTNQWDESVGIAQTPLMDESQMLQWISGGQEIGAHTRHHVNLLDVDDATCRDEIGHGKAEIEAAVKAPVRHFCYPYGSYASRHAAMAGASGYVTATTTQRSRCHAGTDMLEIPRIGVFRSTSLPQFWLKIASSYEDRRRG